MWLPTTSYGYLGRRDGDIITKIWFKQKHGFSLHFLLLLLLFLYLTFFLTLACLCLIYLMYIRRYARKEKTKPNKNKTKQNKTKNKTKKRNKKKNHHCNKTKQTLITLRKMRFTIKWLGSVHTWFRLAMSDDSPTPAIFPLTVTVWGHKMFVFTIFTTR